MKFKKLTAENFLSFKKLSFDFPQTGLHFIGGEVEGGEISNSNGAGKSAALCEALSFGLYGKTIRNVEKDDVVNWNVGKNCVVQVVIEDDDGKEYSIIRFRKDDNYENSLFLLKGKKDLTAADAKRTQELIDEVLGMNFLVFSSAIVFGEKAQRFADARPAEKNEVFDEILILHQFLVAQQTVRADLKQLKEKKQEQEFEVGKSEEGLSVVFEQLKSTNDRLKEFNKSAKETLATVELDKGKCKNLNQDLIKANSRLDRASAAVDKLEDQNQEIFDYVGEVTERRDAALKTLKDKVDSINVNLEITISELDKVDAWFSRPKKAGTRCPSCGQEVTEESLEKTTHHYNAEVARLRGKKQRWQTKYNLAVKFLRAEEEIWQKKFDDGAATKSKLDKTLQEKKQVVQGANIDVVELSSEIKVLKERISSAECSLSREKEQLQKEKADLTTQTNSYRETIAGAKEEIGRINLESKYLNFWIEGFGNKGIKSLLLDEILPALNNRVAFYAATLLDNSIRIMFDTEAMLKSGEARDKFNVKLFQKDHRQIDYKSCSSGEKGRIDAAILLALQSLIFERAGSCSNIVIFDEVFEHLDIVGIERAINLLTEEASDKAIFVISHQNELRDYFDNVITVRKKKGFSVLEV